MQERAKWRVVIGFLAFLCLAVPMETSAGKQQTRMIQASAHNPSYGLFEKTEDVNRRQIDIGPACTYVSHSVSIITANPKEESSGKWSWSDGLIKGEDGRVEAVWIEVRARNKDFFDDPVWLRAQLTVIVEEPNGD